jgi:hypothetical protein
MSMENDGGIILTGWETPVPVSPCPPQIPHGLTRARTQSSAVRPTTNRLSHGTSTCKCWPSGRNAVLTCTYIKHVSEEHTASFFRSILKHAIEESVPQVFLQHDNARRQTKGSRDSTPWFHCLGPITHGPDSSLPNWCLLPKHPSVRTSLPVRRRGRDDWAAVSVSTTYSAIVVDSWNLLKFTSSVTAGTIMWRSNCVNYGIYSKK